MAYAGNHKSNDCSGSENGLSLEEATAIFKRQNAITFSKPTLTIRIERCDNELIISSTKQKSRGILTQQCKCTVSKEQMENEAIGAFEKCIRRGMHVQENQCGNSSNDSGNSNLGNHKRKHQKKTERNKTQTS